MEYKYIQTLPEKIYGEKTSCPVNEPLKIGNSFCHFKYVSDYLKNKFVFHGIATEQDEIYAELGFWQGFNLKTRNFWKIRQDNSTPEQRNQKSSEEIEKTIKHQQDIYKLTYSFGRDERFKNDNFLFFLSFIEDIPPIKTMKILK